MPSRQRLDQATAPWRWACLGAGLGLALALLVWAPASWVTWAISQASQGRVLLESARGTVWEGSAQLTLNGGQGSRDAQALPGRIQWQITPGWLSLHLRLQADCCMRSATHLQLHGNFSGLRVETDAHQSQWPAALLSGLGAPWNTLQAQGQIHLRADKLGLQWTQGRLQMRGLIELQAKDIVSRLSTLKPMGSYQVQLLGSPEGSPTPELFLSTLQGPLQLSGQGQWVGARLRFTGEASADEGSESALSNLLNIIGRRQGARSLLSLG